MTKNVSFPIGEGVGILTLLLILYNIINKGHLKLKFALCYEIQTFQNWIEVVVKN